MGNINYGNQVIIWDYKYPARGADFSVSIKHTLKPGVYYGGTITGDASGNAVIAPLCIIVEDYQNSSIAVKISTSESFVIAVPDESTRYIYMYYTFAEDPYNYMDPGLAETLEEVEEKKGIILGAVTKIGTTLSVNYANKTWGQYDHTTGYYKKFITDQQIEVDLNDGITSPFYIASTVLNTNLNADMVDGYHAGNGSGDIPISNNKLNSYLNADMVDGVHVSASPALNTIPKSDSVEGKLVDGWFHGQVPVGGIMMYGGGNTTDPAPSIPDFLYCDGSAISRTTFATLFNKIGTTWGAGNGVSTFNIPNGKGLIARGLGNYSFSDRVKSGGSLGQYIEDTFQGHEHSLFVNAGESGAGYLDDVASTYNATYKTWGIVTNSINGTPRTSNETKPSTFSIRFYIRYK